ncbi:MAG: YlbG family protein [Bacillus subtilis]|nr:YlbG family protein [Bacillus subtilis]
MITRKGIIVYFQTAKVIPEIEKQGLNITYKNEKRNYVVGYVDATQFERIKKQLETMKNVRKVEESLVDMDQFSFKE